MKQALKAGRIATDNEADIKRLLDAVGKLIQQIPLENTPPQTGAIIYKKINELTGNADPYQQIKLANITQALSLYPALKQKVSGSADGLLTAIRLAVAGNVIDLGVDKEFDLVRDIEIILQQEFARADYEQFKLELDRAENIMYIGDNSGEAVFDKILIEELKKPVIFVVREQPVINDITFKEAEMIGLPQVATVMSSGSPAPGTVLELRSQEFLEKFSQADMIISKGQGNYEGSSAVDRSVFFLLKAKCPVIAENLAVKEDDIVLKFKKGKERSYENRNYNL
jgi:uncharacterized protein with ATP-grasp and redox domains